MRRRSFKEVALSLPHAHNHAHTPTNTDTRPPHANSDSDAPDIESAPVGGSITPTKPRQAPKAAPPPRPVQACTPMEGDNLDQRVDGWVAALKAALDLDARAAHQDALVAYNRLNRQITREAIYEYEQLTCDQKKLLGHVLTCLDRRVHQLRVRSGGSRGHVTRQSLSTGSRSPSSRSPDLEAATVVGSAREVERCVEVLETIGRMRAKGRVPVVLVYRERRCRSHHRHQDKGRSNKVVFAKEKRDFLSLLGLPGSMISEKGLDFTVRPNTASSKKRFSASSSSEGGRGGTGQELEPDQKNGAVATEAGSEEGSPRHTRALHHYLPFIKRGSVSPQHDSASSSTNPSAPPSTAAQDDEGPSVDARSTLSCDSCSSDESSSGTDGETDADTDTAVPAAYVHEDTTASTPSDAGGLTTTSVRLQLEKLGIKNTSRLLTPFLRVSVRDGSGDLAWAGAVQETAQWEVVNRNYLRAPSHLHLQRPLEDVPEDGAIFLELRHHRPDRGVISTLCYTFLERQELSNGEFICELYSPPVDFTRKVLHTYTEKAFFLHLELILQGPLSVTYKGIRQSSRQSSRQGSRHSSLTSS